MGQVPGAGLADAEVAMESDARDTPEAGRDQVAGHGPSQAAVLGALHQGTGLGPSVLEGHGCQRYARGFQRGGDAIHMLPRLLSRGGPMDCLHMQQTIRDRRQSAPMP